MVLGLTSSDFGRVMLPVKMPERSNRSQGAVPSMSVLRKGDRKKLGKFLARHHELSLLKFLMPPRVAACVKQLQKPRR